MRIRSWGAPKRVFLLTALAATALASFTSVALADDIYNTIDATVDAEIESMSLVVGGTNGSTAFNVQPVDDAIDGDKGCNFEGHETMVASITSSNAAVATVTPNQITFGNCGLSQSVAITPVTQGTATFTLAQVSNNTGGTFNFAPATFSVNVGPAVVTNQTPVVTLNGPTNGATYAKGDVPPAACSVTDDQPAPATVPATLSTITGADGLGSQTASCSYTDAGNKTGSASVTYTVADLSAPSIGLALTPGAPNGANGWYVSPVSVLWSITEPESPTSLATTGCGNQAISTDGVHTITCGASSAGGSAATVSETIKLDQLAPTATCDALADVWYPADASIDCNASDDTSGLAGPASFTRSTHDTEGREGTFLISGTTVRDNAGNGTLLDVLSAKVDRKSPTVTCGAAPTFTLGQSPALVAGSAADGGSGVATQATGTADTSTIGTRTTSVTATDNVGNNGSASCSYDVDYRWTGFFQPIDNNAVNKAKSGSTIPVKFSLSGNQGLGVIALGYPASTAMSCTLGAAQDDVEVYTTATSGLRYDSTADQYVYNWKTETRWAGSCRTLTVKLVDGTTHTASFQFTK